MDLVKERLRGQASCLPLVERKLPAVHKRQNTGEDVVTQTRGPIGKENRFRAERCRLAAASALDAYFNFYRWRSAQLLRRFAQTLIRSSQWMKYVL